MNQESDKKQRKGFLKRLFTKEESQESDSEKSDLNKNNDNVKSTELLKTVEPEQKYEYLKYNQYSLKSKDYSFNQLSLINKKCKQLIPLDIQLIAVTDANLFSIDRNNEVKEIFVSSVQIRKGRMSDADIAAMGAPTAYKIPGLIKATRSGNNIVIDWTGTVLESAPSVTGPWSVVTGAAHPHTVVAPAGNVFFKAARQ